jgi:hypothetical protein
MRISLQKQLLGKLTHKEYIHHLLEKSTRRWIQVKRVTGNLNPHRAATHCNSISHILYNVHICNMYHTSSYRVRETEISKIAGDKNRGLCFYFLTIRLLFFKGQ